MALQGAGNDVCEDVSALCFGTVCRLEQAPDVLFGIVGIQFGKAKFEANEAAAKNAMDFEGGGVCAGCIESQVFF